MSQQNKVNSNLTLTSVLKCIVLTISIIQFESIKIHN